MKKTLAIFKLTFLAIVILSVQSCSSDLDDNLKFVDTSSLIRSDDKLAELLGRAVNSSGNSMEDIVCIDFIYPLSLLIYDENYQVTATRYLTGDDEFSELLDSLSDMQSISISYPITTTFSDGSTFSINNNQELKIAIENCSREDIVQYCGTLFGSNPRCIWQLPYSENNDNTYASGIFTVNEDGTINFNFNDQNYIGTWAFLFFNDELQMNINLEGISEVAQYWNFSRKIEINGDIITIIADSENLILKKKCEEIDIYGIGDEGPAGGIVFYDKGFYANGWRYMEASTTDFAFLEWGCSSLTTQTSSTEVGKGWYNSIQIANFHDNLTNYYINPSVCNASNDGSVISKTVLLYSFQDFKDWFLPSENELLLIYENLYLQNLGTFTNTTYWSSTEADTQNAKAINFNNGETLNMIKNQTDEITTRAVRYF